MIDYGVFTGEMEDDYVEVQMAQEIIYARPVFAFPLIAQITEEWLSEYKDNFIAIVSYLRDSPEKPLLIGLANKVDNNFPTEGEKNYFIITKKFRAWLSDKDNKFIIDALDDGEILLGDKDVTEPIVLGNKWETFMGKLIDAVAQITVTSPIGVTSTPINGQQILALKQELETILSKKVKSK